MPLLTLCIDILIAHSLIPLLVKIISGLAYLAAKGKEEGVVTLPSGLLYKEIRPGNGEFIFMSVISWVVVCGGGICRWPFSHTFSICTHHIQPMAKRPPSIHPVNGEFSFSGVLFRHLLHLHKRRSLSINKVNFLYCVPQ